MSTYVADYTNPSGLNSTELNPETNARSLEQLEALRLINEQKENANGIIGTGASFIAELGGGMFLAHKLHRSAKFAQTAKNISRTMGTLKVLNNAKKLSIFGMAAPEAVSTVSGIAAYGLAEAAIWGVSNFAGQSIRKGYGLQDEYSAGESIASAVFGLGVVNSVADKAFRLGGASLQSLKAWKTKEYAIQGGKLLVSGAALGIAETAMRQELQILMNERENREIMEYYLAAGLGGVLNTGFGLIATTGQWGRNIADTSISNTDKRLNKQLKALTTERDRLSALGKKGQVKKIEKQIREVQQAVDVIGDLKIELEKAGKTLKDFENPEKVTQAKEKFDEVKDPDVDPVVDPTPTRESNYEDVPPSANAQKTQVTSTTPTYERASSILSRVQGKLLDFGAGLGIGARRVGADTYEPFPKGDFEPNYKDSSQIPDESYEKITSLSVLNVVPPDIRENIVTEIGRILKTNGEAIITARKVNDVAQASTKIASDIEPNAYIIGDKANGTYQKGFTQVELEDYVRKVLGENFEVTIAPRDVNGKPLNGAAVIVKKLESPEVKVNKAKAEDAAVEFLDKHGLTLEDFVIDIDGNVSLNPKAGSSASGKTPTLSQIGMYTLFDYQVSHKKGGSLKGKIAAGKHGVMNIRTSERFGKRNIRTNLNQVIDTLVSDPSKYLNIGEDTEGLLNILKTFRENYSDLFENVSVRQTKQVNRAQAVNYAIERPYQELDISMNEDLPTLVHEIGHIITSKTLHKYAPARKIDSRGRRTELKGKAYLDYLSSVSDDASKPQGVRDLVKVYLEVVRQLDLEPQVINAINSGGGGDLVTANGFAYGLGNIHEFVSEALMNPVFQRELNSIQITLKGQKPKTLWAKFKKAIAKVFKIDIKENSALDLLLDSVGRISRLQNERARLISEAYDKLDPKVRDEMLNKAFKSYRDFRRKYENEGLEFDIDVSTKTLDRIANIPFLPIEFVKPIEHTVVKDGANYVVRGEGHFTLSRSKAMGLRDHAIAVMKSRLRDLEDSVQNGTLVTQAASRNKLKVEGKFIQKGDNDSFFDMSITDEAGNQVSFKDLPEEVQGQVTLFLKANSGRYKNPKQEPDVGSTKVEDSEPVDSSDVTTDQDIPEANIPPIDPPLNEGGATNAPEDSRWAQIRDLEKVLEGVTSANMTTLMPELERAVRKLEENLKQNMEQTVTDLITAANDGLGFDYANLPDAIDEIRLLRALNKVRDAVETTAGRTVQAARADAEKFASSSRYSIRAIKEDEALAEIEELLHNVLKGKDTTEIESLGDLMEDYLDDFFDHKLPMYDAFLDDASIDKMLDQIEPPKVEPDDVTGDTPVVVEGTQPPKKPKEGATQPKRKKTDAEKELERRENRIKRQIEKLQKRLDAARKEFVAEQPLKRTIDEDGNVVEGTNDTDLGLEDALIDQGDQPPQPKRKKDARIARLENLLNFYVSSRQELVNLIKAKRERARLADIEGRSVISEIEGVVKPKPKTKRQPQTELDKVRKDIADIKKRLGDKLKAIRKAEQEIAAESSADNTARLKSKLAKRKEQLQKKLDAYRARFADRSPTDDVPTRERRKLEDEETKALEDQIKFYQRAEREAEQAAKLEQELLNTLGVEGRAVMSEMKGFVEPKPTGPVSDSKVKQLRKKIADSRARMRKKLRDIENARLEMQREDMYRAFERYFLASLDTDVASRVTRFIRKARQLRQLALIDQLPSVLAGVPTGAFGVAKQLFRIPVKFLSALARNQNMPLAKQIARAEIQATAMMFSDMGDLLKSFKRSFMQNESATDRQAGRFDIDNTNASLPRGIHATVLRAKRTAARKRQAAQNVGERFLNMAKRGFITDILSLGVRGIIGVDDVFKRMILKARMYSEASRRALLEFPNDPAKMKQKAQEIYESGWKDQDGLPVLADTLDFYDELDNVRTELLFASNADNIEDVYTSSVEKFIKGVQGIIKDDGFVGTFANALFPFFGVATRGVWRTGRLVVWPALGPRAFASPYRKNIKAIEADLKNLTDVLDNPNIDPKLKEGVPEDIKLLNSRLEQVKIRELKYKEELMTDIMVGASLSTMGLIAGASGALTGSLTYLTPDQRRKLQEGDDKVYPFRFMGMDYKAALPITFPLAVYGDIGAYLRLRRIQDITGQPILREDQTLVSVFKSSFVAMAKELPLTSGINTFEDLLSENSGEFNKSLERLILSYVPNPAEARKVIKAITVEDNIPDLKGGSFYDRVAYQVFGVGPVNYKTDTFGFDLETDANFVTDTIWRQAPRFKFEDPDLFYSQWGEILASDSQNQISKKPKNLQAGVNMDNWVDEEGVKLSYEFSRRLREYRIGNKTLRDAVKDLIFSSRWRKLYEKGYVMSQTNPEVYENEGLEQLNDLIRTYYNNVRNSMLRDKALKLRFINKEDMTLDRYLKLTIENINVNGTGKPFSLKDFFN